MASLRAPGISRPLAAECGDGRRAISAAWTLSTVSSMMANLGSGVASRNCATAAGGRSARRRRFAIRIGGRMSARRAGARNTGGGRMRVLVLAVMMVLATGCWSTAGKSPADAGPGAIRSSAAPPGGPMDGTVPSADSVVIHYHVEGTGSPAVVLLHGWACDASIWDGQVKELSPRYTVVTIDLAGHGRSGRERATWSMPAFAEDARAVIEKLQLRRVVLVGHSMSGYVILEAARLIPDRVAALVPVDTLQDVEWKPGKGIDEWLDTMRTDFVSSTSEFVKEMFPETADPALVERMASRMSAMPPEIGVAVLRAVFSYDKATALSRVKQPIRAINSDKFPTRLEVNRRYAPQFEAVSLPGTGHFPMLENPAEFNRLELRRIAPVQIGRAHV